MKRVLVVAILLWIIALSCSDDLEKRIMKYAGENASGFIALMDDGGEKAEMIRYILEYSSPSDLAMLTPAYLEENVEYALKTREFEYTKIVPQDVFMHFVLPPRISQEPFEPWRVEFFNELEPLVQEAETLEEAMMIVSLWCSERNTFEPTSGRDQAPLTTLKRVYGRCEEIMILEIAAARSVGIPMRPVSAPFWNFMDNNHAWNEMWTPDGWKYMGPKGPSNAISDTWFSKRASRSILILSHAFGEYPSDETLKYENRESLLNTTSTYNQPTDYTIHVRDEQGAVVEDAEVVFYALSYGGLFPMLELKSDEGGEVHVALGGGSTFVTVARDSLFGYGLVNRFEAPESIEITMNTDRVIDGEFMFRFPIEAVTENPPAEPIFEDLSTRQELANLRREKSLANDRKHLRTFLNDYDVVPDEGETVDQFKARRDGYLQKCEKLAGACDQYLDVYAALADDPARTGILNTMIESWDIKDLIEIPDSARLHAIIDVFEENRARYSVPDSIWRENVVGPIFPRKPMPESGWQTELYDRVKHLHRDDIMQTVDAVRTWLDETVTRDTTLTSQYFAGSMDPLQILNMKHVSWRGQIYLFTNVLKYMGIPVRWKGHLEIYDGQEFVRYDLSDDFEDEEQPPARSIRVNVYADGNQVQAEPFGNFLLCAVSGNGGMYYTYFDEQRDSLTSIVTWYPDEDAVYNVQGYVRNANGDAKIVIRDLGAIADSTIALHLETPADLFDVSESWDEDIIDRVKEIASRDEEHGYRIVFVRTDHSTEPQIRMIDEFESKSKILTDRKIGFILYSELGNRERVPGFAVEYKGKSFLDLESSDYPVLFLIDDQDQVIFSSKGYRLGVSDLVIRKCK